MGEPEGSPERDALLVTCVTSVDPHPLDDPNGPCMGACLNPRFINERERTVLATATMEACGFVPLTVRYRAADAALAVVARYQQEAGAHCGLDALGCGPCRLPPGHDGECLCRHFAGDGEPHAPTAAAACWCYSHQHPRRVGSSG